MPSAFSPDEGWGATSNHEVLPPSLNRKWEDIWPYLSSITLLIMTSLPTSARQKYTPAG